MPSKEKPRRFFAARQGGQIAHRSLELLKRGWFSCGSAQFCLFCPERVMLSTLTHFFKVCFHTEKVAWLSTRSILMDNRQHDCLEEGFFFFLIFIFWLLCLYLIGQMKVCSGNREERGREWHTVKGHRVDWTCGCCSEKIASLHGAPTLPTELWECPMWFYNFP